MNAQLSEDEQLLLDLALYSSDPLGFVYWAFPWQEPGTELFNRSGPEDWQIKVLTEIGLGLLTPEQAIREAVSSGHGVGKSALVSWIILWALSTFENTRGVVTANTETQLKTKTWAELAKWHRLFIANRFFDYTATKISSKDPAYPDWRIDMVPWSERNTEAFAGLHNQGKRILVVFDEASAIPDVIHETTEGALTDANTQIIWLMCGNPTRPTGRFVEAMPGGRFGRLWNFTKVDSRMVSFTNKAQIESWIESYGEDSDFVRVRVKGELPRAGTMQFIDSDSVNGAMALDREAYAQPFDPLIIGVDVARFGDDDSVIFFRKGRDARSIPYIRLRPSSPSEPWTMILAGRVAEEYNRYRADAVFVDGGGVGGGVVDRLRQLQIPVFDIQFGARADRPVIDGEALYANKRAEIWGWMKAWLRGGIIPEKDQELRAQLLGPEYGFNAKNEIQLEKKEDMKKRGVASPDIADALALTFSYSVAPNINAGHIGADRKPLVESEYDPFSEKMMAA